MGSFSTSFSSVSNQEGPKHLAASIDKEGQHPKAQRALRKLPCALSQNLTIPVTAAAGFYISAIRRDEMLKISYKSVTLWVTVRK